VLIIKGPQGRINRAVWGPLNRTIISAGEDAIVRIWDSEVTSLPFYRTLFFPLQFASIVTPFLICLQTGKLLKESDKESGHKKTVTSLAKSADGSHFLTGSLDKSAKVSLCFRDFLFLLILVFLFSFET